MDIEIGLKVDPTKLKAGLEESRRALLSTFADASKGVGAAKTALGQAEAEAQKMAKSLRAAGAPSQQMLRDFEAVRAAVRQAKEAVIQKTRAMQDARGAVKANAADIEKMSRLEQKYAKEKEARDTAAAERKRSLAQQEAAEAAAQQMGADRGLLGVSAHAEVETQIEAVRAAYERLKASGKLTDAELAQAAMRSNDRIRELSAGTNGWSESLMKAKVALAGVGVAGAGIGYVVKQAMDFETAMAGVAKVVDGTDEQVAALADDLRKMAQEMPVEGGLSGLADIAAAGGQLGVPIEKLTEFTELVAKMGVAFNMSAEQAGSAKQFGLSAEQAAALAAAFTSLGKPVQVAGTAINALLSKLQTANVQGDEFKTALQEMGLSANQLAKDIRENPQKALMTFLQTLKSLDGQQHSELLVCKVPYDYILQSQLAFIPGRRYSTVSN
jgi:chromosome segregation ATPase